MLRKPRFLASTERNPMMDLLSNEDTITEIHEGVYKCGHFNFEYELGEAANKYAEFGEVNAYGVCDSVDQLLAAYDFESDPRSICISVTRIDKATQPANGGWRWHKWGPYIGTQQPRHEYLYDEQNIEVVYVYHIYELTERTATVQ